MRFGYEVIKNILTLFKYEKKVWILQTGEPLIIDQGPIRKMRSLNLIESLIEKNIHITHWTSNFDHISKTHRILNCKDRVIEIKHSQNLKIKLINTPGYYKHIGLRRFYDHYIMGQNVKKELQKIQELPDLVIIGFPQ